MPGKTLDAFVGCRKLALFRDLTDVFRQAFLNEIFAVFVSEMIGDYKGCAVCGGVSG
jgi:hypothetical protein